MRIIAAILLGIPVLGCAVATPPPSFGQLESFVEAGRIEKVNGPAPLAWSEGLRYWSLAEEALDRGKLDQADRYAQLGIIQLKIALADAKQVAARKRWSELKAELLTIEKEIERTAHATEQMEVELERIRLRRHLVSVVQKTRRQAAAQELTTEQRLSPEKHEELRAARREVGWQLIHRARVWRSMIDVWTVHAGVAGQTLSQVDAALERALNHLKNGALVDVQQNVEQVAIEARRVITDRLELTGAPVILPGEPVLQELEAAGFTVTSEEYGTAITIPAFGVVRNRLTKRQEKKLAPLGQIVKDRDLQLMVLTTGGGFHRPKQAQQKSDEMAATITKSLIRSGLRAERITPVGCGFTAPLAALREKSHPFAVLLVLRLKEK